MTRIEAVSAVISKVDAEIGTPAIDRGVALYIANWLEAERGVDIFTRDAALRTADALGASYRLAYDDTKRAWV